MNMVVIRISKKYFRPNEVDNLIGNASKAKNIKMEVKTSIDQLIKEMLDQDLKKIK